LFFLIVVVVCVATSCKDLAGVSAWQAVKLKMLPQKLIATPNVALEEVSHGGKTFEIKSVKSHKSLQCVCESVHVCVCVSIL